MVQMRLMVARIQKLHFVVTFALLFPAIMCHLRKPRIDWTRTLGRAVLDKWNFVMAKLPRER